MVRLKKVITIFLSLMIVLTAIPGMAHEATDFLPPWLDEYDVRILLNGNYLESNVFPREMDDGTILVPIRLVLENAGYKVKWNDNGIINISNNKETVNLNSKDNKFNTIFINGHVLSDLAFFKEFKNFSTKYDLINKTVIMESSNISNTDVRSYDLGTRTMRTVLDRDLTYRLNGGIIAPETNNNPLVLIMHGSHGVNKSEENRFDLGYSYLMKELAEKGYTAISLNVNMQYSYEDGEPMGSERIDAIFEETLKELITANAGTNNNFSIDLKDKIDFNKVALIGHSRSGQEIFKFTDKYKDDERIDIKALISIAPSAMYVMDYTEIDIPTSIILPELDGDVISLDGQMIFDEMISDDDKKSEAQLVYLYGANHNAFNQALLKQDNGKADYESDTVQMSRGSQRQFLKDYSVKFFDTVFDSKSLYKELGTKTGDLMGYTALVSNYMPGVKTYKAGSGLTNIENNQAAIKDVVYSYMYDVNTTGLFKHPGNNEKLDLLNIKWDKKNASVGFKVDSSLDLKNKNTLSIYMAQDSTDEINKKENQSFKITLEDSSGKKSSLLLDEDNPHLKFQDGKVMPGFVDFYSSHTPLSIMNIDLDEFDGIDKNNIEKVSLDFTEKEQGSIMLRFIQFN